MLLPAKLDIGAHRVPIMYLPRKNVGLERSLTAITESENSSGRRVAHSLKTLRV